MNPEILTALIEAAGTIIASIIGVAGVFLIVKNRKDIIKLSMIYNNSCYLTIKYATT